MGRDGFRVLDADTHVYEPCEVLEGYLSSQWKDALARSATPITRTALRGGMHTYIVGDPKSGQRRLGIRGKVSRPTAPRGDKRDAGTPRGVLWNGPPWPAELFPITPVGMPIDDPGLDPLWARAVEYDLAVLVHPFNLSNPRSPGLADLWDNIFLERAAGGVWAGMRAVAAITGSGMLDRFPGMRVGVVETGHGWLASWAFHLDEVAEMTQDAIAPPARKPSDYVRGPQFFQSIEMHEGEGTVRSIIELLGPDTLMFGTDYPHTECWFPKSVETILGWHTISDEAKRKLLWGNGVSLYRRCQGG